MNKSLYVIALSFIVISMLGLASAVPAAGADEKTLVAGKIYNADFSGIISGASVTVNCDGHIESATSLNDGSYSVIYNAIYCNELSPLTVSAVKGNLYGSKTGIIHDNAFGTWDLAIVNVPLVPEFGVIVGGLTILSALGVFFMIRRR